MLPLAGQIVVSVGLCWSRCEGRTTTPLRPGFIGGNPKAPGFNAGNPEASGFIGENPKGNRTFPKQQGSLKETLMQPGLVMDIPAYASVLRYCSTAKSLSHGKRVHHHIIHNAIENNVFLANLTLHMYGNCGALDDAHALFGKMHHRDRFSWNFIIMACARNRKGGDALLLFDWMMGEGFMPDKFIYPSILSACADQAALADGKRIHGYIKSTRCELDLVIANALISMYGNCGSLEDARVMFDKIVERDVISWNAIIYAYAQHELGLDTLYLYERMDQAGVQPNKATFISMLLAFGNAMTLAEAKYIHAQVREKGFEEDLAVGNAIISMYAKCSSLADAERMFQNMLDRDIVSWNGIITVHVQHGNSKNAIQHFHRMREEGIAPNKATFARILSTCASNGALFEGMQFYACISCSGNELDVFTMTTLVSLHCKCGSLQEARCIFDMMQKRDAFSWNDMIAAYAHHGRGMEALTLFHQMQGEGLMPDKFIFASVISACTSTETFLEGKRLHTLVIGSGFELDTVVGTALVNMYGKCGSFEEARRLFEKIPERNTLSWSTMIAVFIQNKQGKDALESFSQMCGEGMLPNKATLVNILSACAFLAELKEGRRLHVCILGIKFKSDVVLGTALVNMYGKCGSMKDACGVFDDMWERNTLSWNALIAAYAQHGQGINALKTFHSMQRDTVLPDNATLVSVLSACSHAGLVDEGVHCFSFLNWNGCILPDVDHFNCMIDTLGRAGRLEEAESFVSFTPFHPTVISWITLLNACRHLSDIKRGECAAIHGWELDPGISGPYITLANLCAAEHECGVNKQYELGFEETASCG